LLTRIFTEQPVDFLEFGQWKSCARGCAKNRFTRRLFGFDESNCASISRLYHNLKQARKVSFALPFGIFPPIMLRNNMAKAGNTNKPNILPKSGSQERISLILHEEKLDKGPHLVPHDVSLPE
jgi:hypothetical protein